MSMIRCFYHKAETVISFTTVLRIVLLVLKVYVYKSRSGFGYVCKPISASTLQHCWGTMPDKLVLPGQQHLYLDQSHTSWVLWVSLLVIALLFCLFFEFFISQCPEGLLNPQYEVTTIIEKIIKGKAIRLHTRTGPESSSRLRLPDFKTIGAWRW
jgi:hypothetical protein